MRLKISVLLMLIWTSVAAQIQTLVSKDRINPDLLDHKWTAQWIAHPTESCPMD